MRGLGEFVEPDKLDSQGTGAAFVFRYGVLVLFRVTFADEQQFFARIEPNIIDSLRSPEVETAMIESVLDADEQVDAHGDIQLRELTPARLLLTATVLARSVVLGRDETRIANVFDGIEPLVNAMQQHGHVGQAIDVQLANGQTSPPSLDSH